MKMVETAVADLTYADLAEAVMNAAGEICEAEEERKVFGAIAFMNILENINGHTAKNESAVRFTGE